MVGLLGIVHEVVISRLDRPSIAVLLAGMTGLPVFLRNDERRQASVPPPDGVERRA